MILELIKEGKIDDAVKLLSPKDGVSDYSKEYTENARDMRDTQVGKRLDKTLKDGKVVVAKIPIPFQRLIVQSACSFLFGSPVNVTSEADMEAISDLWEECRMDTRLLNFAEKVKSETEAAIVFFGVEKDKEVKIKARVLSSENGTLVPVFDSFGDMIAFSWQYKAKQDSKEVEFLHLFTEERNYVFKKTDKWEEDTELSKPNLLEKIPVVYYSQKYPEWWMVKELIDRYEMNFSKFADTNDYFSSPMYKAKGAVTSIPKKDDTGKMVKLDIVETEKGNIISADVDVISWDRAPEALKLEFETGKDLIYGLTNTPDLSFNNVKGMNNVSGFALQMMFFGSILKAKWDEGDYKEVVGRCLNVLKACAIKLKKTLNDAQGKEMKFDVQFTSVLPENMKETIDMLQTATGGKGVMSQKSAIAMNPMVEDPEGEQRQIVEESKVDSMGLAN